MSISAGTRLGRYEIRAKLGEGGMGEVYRATDTKLGRDVAVKVLPAAYSTDIERLRRFEQEAQAAGALNHPNILAIYDVSTHDGAPYVVSELLEGETLRDCLSAAGLPARKAVDYALQITHGLAAAHEKGIIHRDLKPENLFITRDGRVKILDFGLAKLIDSEVGSAGPAGVPTREVHTNPGAVMGTIGYMSPEQVRGQTVDHRSDIFSFGAVLYEMLSGRRAFRGDSAADAVSALLKEDPPDLSATNTHISPGLERVVRRCLEKNREQRFHSASDLAFALEALTGVQGSGAATIGAPGATIKGVRLGLRRTFFDRLGWTLAAVFLITTALLATLHWRRVMPGGETIHFTVPAPEKAAYGDGLALAPDGRSLAFVAMGAQGAPSLWIRPFDSEVARELPGTEEASFPFWSPDSRFLAFFAGNKLKKIAVSGGPAQALADMNGEARGGAWGPDGTILFAPGYTSALYKVAASGGAPATLATALDASRNQTSHRWPSFLPDGRRFMYFSRATQKESEGIYVASLDSTEPQFLLNTSHLASFAPVRTDGSTGHLLFIRETTLVAQPFDAGRLQLSGEPFAIIDGVLNFPGETGPTAYAAFSASRTGHLAYLRGKESLTQMGWFDRKGNRLETVVPPGDYHEPRLSADHKKVVFGREDKESSDIWLLDLARSTMTRLTFDPAIDVSPVWSPDGSRIVFSSSRGGKQQLYEKISSGAGSDEALLRTEYNAYTGDWTTTAKDGSFIVYDTESEKTRFDLYVLPLSGDRKPIPFLNTPFNETHAQFSPDGRWVAYSSDESGRSEVYVQSFPASGGKWQVSTSGGDQAQWRRDGRELFYISPDKELMAVPVTPAASFEAGVPIPLFTTRVPTTSLTDDRNNFVPAADGQRFLVNNLVDEGNAQPITMILHWAAGRRR